MMERLQKLKSIFREFHLLSIHSSTLSFEPNLNLSTTMEQPKTPNIPTKLTIVPTFVTTPKSTNIKY